MTVYQTSGACKMAFHEYYNMDSKGECDFAKQLDADEHVVLFTKLKKGGFVIDTSDSHYTVSQKSVRKKLNFTLLIVNRSQASSPLPMLAFQSNASNSGSDALVSPASMSSYTARNLEDPD